MRLITEDEVVAILERVKPQLAMLDAEVQLSGEAPEGNILYMHQSFEPNPKNLAKQRNLLSLAKSLPQEDAVIVEVGFNAGHSSLLMLAAHPTAQVIVFDLCEHSYTKACFAALSSAFPGRLQLVAGKSQQTIPAHARSHCLRADLLHIDGDHRDFAARADLENCAKLARAGALVIFDDICFSPLAAVWKELHERGLLKETELPLSPTNRHGVASYTRPPPKACDELLWDLTPALAHRGRMRHVLVLAPTDHGQDSLLGYLMKHRSWQGRAQKCQKLAPNTTDRHQSPWMSLPLRLQSRGQMPTLVHLVAPPFHDAAQIAACFPLVDGFLAVVDCAAELTQDFRNNFRSAAQKGLQPVLFLNKLDKLLSLEPDNETCYQRLSGFLDDMNTLLEGTHAIRLQVLGGNVVFGRGSLSVAESIGGWGFTVRDILQDYAVRKGWSEEQLENFSARVWGDHFFSGRTSGSSRERGFCALVLRPLRDLFSALEAGYVEGCAKLGQLGVTPPEGLTGNAWKQGSVEAWLPLADVLLHSVALHVPPPRATVGGVFYAATTLSSADGRSVFALGRRIASPVPGLPTLRAEDERCRILNGPLAIETPHVQVGSGAMLGIQLKSPHAGPALIEC